MASDKPFNYHSGLWLLLVRIILSQTCSNSENDSSEDSKKIRFSDLERDAKPFAGFSPSCQFQVGWNDVT